MEPTVEARLTDTTEGGVAEVVGSNTLTRLLTVLQEGKDSKDKMLIALFKNCIKTPQHQTPTINIFPLMQKRKKKRLGNADGFHK